jgi:hypothetical protein
MPGEPNVLVLCPVVVVPPMGAEEPKVVPVPESVPPVVGVELEVPLLPNGEDPVLPVGEEPKGELLLLEDDPNPELPNEDPDDDPNGEEPVVVPDVVPVEAPVGVMPLAFCIVWPNKPIAGTFASPRWIIRQSSFPVKGSR